MHTSPASVVDARVSRRGSMRPFSFPVGEGGPTRSGGTDGARRRRVPRSGNRASSTCAVEPCTVSASPNARPARPIRLGFAEPPSPTGKEVARLSRRAPPRRRSSGTASGAGRCVNRLALAGRGRGWGSCRICSTSLQGCSSRFAGLRRTSTARRPPSVGFAATFPARGKEGLQQPDERDPPRRCKRVRLAASRRPTFARREGGGALLADDDLLR